MEELERKSWLDVLDYFATNDSYIEVFKGVRKNNDFVNMVEQLFSNRQIVSSLTLWMDVHLKKYSSSKNIEKGKSYRMKGNDRFKVGDYSGSIDFYSKSIRFVTIPSNEYPLALANRSAANFYLGNYDECLNDIELALKYDYPDHLQHKLYLRKGKIHLIRKQLQQASVALKKAKLCMPVNTKDNVRKDLEEALSAALSNMDNITDDTLEDSKKGLPEKTDLIFLKENSEKGRYIVAKSDIKKGDVLFVEKPFAFVVLPGSSLSVCHDCCAEVKYAFIPCKYCVSAVFCSEPCFERAWNMFHKWECGGLELFYSVGIAHLGLRVTLIDNERYPGRIKNLSPMSSLLDHKEDMELIDAFHYCLTATVLTLYLIKYKNYFEKYEISKFRFGGNVLCHIYQLVCNGHAITKVDGESSSGFTLSKTEGVIESCQDDWAGTGIFPEASMMNHSCDPNIINSFCNDVLIVKAIRDIPKGEEVFNCYGPHYRRMSTNDRKKVLKKQYFFDCSCPPCQKEGCDDFLAQFSAFLCSFCNGRHILPSTFGAEGKCLDCGSKEKSSSLLKNLKYLDDSLPGKALEKMTNNQFNEAIKLYKDILSVLSKCFHKHHTKLREYRDNIAKCYACIEKFDIGASYLIENLDSIEQQFGDDSIEVANEIQKITDLLIADIKLSNPNNKLIVKCKEIKKFVDKANRIYKICYGDWNECYRQMLDKESFLAELCTIN